MVAATVTLADKIGFDRGEFLGYTTIVLSFLLVCFGIRSYRDGDGNGQITFARAFGVGISITLIMCVCYVVTWQVIYFNYMHNFVANTPPMSAIKPRPQARLRQPSRRNYSS
jgi:Protein of unknown function (DUF4199)